MTSSEEGRRCESALEWAQVRAPAADGVSRREIARRLQMNRRTVAQLLASGEPPRYQIDGALVTVLLA
jgi:DNA-binding transcriptional regulator LsrR (DeoR family)